MNRVERRRYRKVTKRRIFLGIVMCVFLFYCGLKVVDMGTEEMLGEVRNEVLLNFSEVEGDIIQVDVAGEKLLINKRKIKDFVRVFQDKLGKFKEEVMVEE